MRSWAPIPSGGPSPPSGPTEPAPRSASWPSTARGRWTSRITASPMGRRFSSGRTCRAPSRSGTSRRPTNSARDPRCASLSLGLQNQLGLKVVGDRGNGHRHLGAGQAPGPANAFDVNIGVDEQQIDQMGTDVDLNRRRGLNVEPKIETNLIGLALVPQLERRAGGADDTA